MEKQFERNKTQILSLTENLSQLIKFNTKGVIWLEEHKKAEYPIKTGKNKCK